MQLLFGCLLVSLKSSVTSLYAIKLMYSMVIGYIYSLGKSYKVHELLLSEQPSFLIIRVGLCPAVGRIQAGMHIALI